ncbi:membrane protein insertase YidC [Novosphingobium tardum]|uniref:Membrane protein insertase YidC n=1 Tax=Novosphingobium tardum TaxID=1538021 RepID=A0ABV8RL30_9SPHN
MDNQRNLILAVVLTGLLLLGWDGAMRYLYPAPPKPAAVATAPAGSAPVATTDAGEPAAQPRTNREGGLTAAADVAAEQRDLAVALAGGNRVPIAGPRVSGSINLVGAVIDDLTLNDHRSGEKKNTPPVRMLSPAGTPAQQFVQVGWVGADGGNAGIQLPDARTVWTAQGSRLTAQTPVTLRWSNATGQDFAIRFAIDANYMITATQTVANRGGAPVVVRPFALVNRTDRTASADSFNVHSGPIGAFDGSVDFGTNYKDVRESEQRTVTPAGRPTWIGFTDVYWLSALIPQTDAAAQADFRSLGNSIYRADLIYRPTALAPGQQLTRTTRMFSGAKENRVLDAYEAAGISNFSLAIDWGWFRWFEKPIFYLLDWLFRLAGNFGVAIILLTVIIRSLMFPVAQKQFKSMAAMRAIQPKMKALQERYKDDKPTLQAKTMELYKNEGVNPLAGCLPIFLQIPVFFALYKVLILTIEMRHQPFVLWIKDLSAPDPLHLLNLFGLLPFTPPSFLAIGLLALILGITTYFQFKLNPQPMDPAQAQVFAFMPWIMMFVMAPFAAGLLIYWITSNLLTIAQQKYLYMRHPQLKAQNDKDAADRSRAKERDTARPAPTAKTTTTRAKPKPRTR